MDHLIDTVNPFKEAGAGTQAMNILDRGDPSLLNIKSFLIIGQSNMAGRGSLDGTEPLSHPKCFMLRMGRWQFLSEPVNVDRGVTENSRPRSGACLATSFAIAYADTFSANTGIIPCADGGTRIDQWAPGGLLFDHAVMQAKLAMRTSRLTGILWHQGESDCTSPNNLKAYPEKFRAMIAAFRGELGNLPVVVGELGHVECGFGVSKYPFFTAMNGVINSLPDSVACCAAAKADGLASRGDGLHFDTPALREFGKRYFKAYRMLMG